METKNLPNTPWEKPCEVSQISDARNEREREMKFHANELLKNALLTTLYNKVQFVTINTTDNEQQIVKCINIVNYLVYVLWMNILAWWTSIEIQ